MLVSRALGARRPPVNRSSRGLALIELVVVSLVFLFLTGIVHETFRYQWHGFAAQSAEVASQQDLRVWVARIVHDARRAGFDPREYNRTLATGTAGRFRILTFTSTEFTFTTDFDSDGTLDSDPRENRGYRLADGKLELWQGGSSWRPVLDGVTSLEFVYRDATDAVTNIRKNVRRVDVSLTAEPVGAAIPGVEAPLLTQSASADLRNEMY